MNNSAEVFWCWKEQRVPHLLLPTAQHGPLAAAAGGLCAVYSLPMLRAARTKKEKQSYIFARYIIVVRSKPKEIVNLNTAYPLQFQMKKQKGMTLF